MTRMVFAGKPGQEKLTVYKKLLSSQEKTIKFLSKKISTGLAGKDIDMFCRKQLIKNLLPSYPHSTGHGVGLEVHEYPKLSSLSEDKILANQVITIEPGVYFPDKWGMRIEDTVLVKDKNMIEVLTKFDKKPLII